MEMTYENTSMRTVRQLEVGDVLFASQTVIVGTRAVFNGKRKVDVRYLNGEVITREWYATTSMRVFRPAK